MASTALSGSPTFLSPAGVFTDDVDGLGQPQQQFGQAAFSDAALTSLVDGLDSGGWFDTGVRADLAPGQSLMLRYHTSADGPEMFVPALTALPGDVNLDGTVGPDDLTVILENLRATGSQLLSEGSSGMGGGVPLRDVSQMLTYWGSSIDLPAPPTHVHRRGDSRAGDGDAGGVRCACSRLGGHPPPPPRGVSRAARRQPVALSQGASPSGCPFFFGRRT